MLDSKDRLKLADFGIAMVVSDSRARVSGSAESGTPAYMSPQQINGERPRPTDDIYSLGASLYELLTGTPPFYSGQIVHQALHNPPTPVPQRLSDLGLKNHIPGDVEAMIMACLAKEPGHRPQSARAIADWVGLQAASHPKSLKATLSEERGSQGEASHLEGEHTSEYARTGVFALLALLVLSLLGAGGWWLNSKMPRGAVAPPPGVNNKEENDQREAFLEVETSSPSVQVQPAAEAEAHPARIETLLFAENFEHFAEGTIVKTKYQQGIVLAEKGNHFLRLAQSSAITNRSYVFPTVVVPENWRQIKVSCRIRTRNLKLNIGSRFSSASVTAELYGESPKATYLFGGFQKVTHDTDWVIRTGTWERTNVPASARKLHVGLHLRLAAGIADFDDVKATVVEASSK
jgi:serine/threonine protein kinase